jgi:hypothetical protein
MDFDFNFDMDFEVKEQGGNSRYIMPKDHDHLPEKFVKFDNAIKLAKELKKDDPALKNRTHILCDGSFVFGDFIEAFCYEYNCCCKEITISTLGYSEANIISLQNLIEGGYIKNLNMITSAMFESHNRGKSGLIMYALEELDINNIFQMAVCRDHTKMVLIETLGGKKICIHGSANFRASDSIERFTIEENTELYNFEKKWRDQIIKDYMMIVKNTPGGKKIPHGKCIGGKKYWDSTLKKM